MRVHNDCVDVTEMSPSDYVRSRFTSLPLFRFRVFWLNGYTMDIAATDIRAALDAAFVFRTSDSGEECGDDMVSHSNYFGIASVRLRTLYRTKDGWKETDAE